MKDIVNLWQVRTAAAALAAFPLASLEAVASTASASGSAVALSPSYSPYAHSFSFSQPTTSSAFTDTTNPGASTDFSQASYDGVHGFSVVAAQSKYFIQQSNRSQASLAYTTSIVNTTTSSQPTTFSFTISSISFNVANFFPLYSGQTMLSSFAARVYAGASAAPIWSTGFSLTQTNSNYSLDIASETGSSIGMLASYNAAISQLPYSYGQASFGISGYSTVLNLGNLNPGDALNLRYEVDVDAESNAYGGDARVSFADPVADLAFSGAVAAVPEPSESALLIGGIALLGAVVRRRRNLADPSGERG